MSPLRVLVWNVHGSYTDALVRGPHDYLLPLTPDGGPDGPGRLGYPWPPNAREVPVTALRDEDIDVVVLQREREVELCRAWTGRRPGHDLPAVWLEHNAPQGRVTDLRHPAGGLPGTLLVHVTHFNDLFWDAGTTPTRVVEHGVPDPGYRYTGELPRGIAVINEARRRGRVTGTDLLPRFAGAAPVDLAGIGSDELGGLGDVRHEDLIGVVARRRVYLHPVRWTSLGLSLIEAMLAGMPVVALATTEVVEAVPAGAGAVSTDVGRLVRAFRRLVDDPREARRAGMLAREAACDRYGLARFLADWDRVLAEAGG